MTLHTKFCIFGISVYYQRKKKIVTYRTEDRIGCMTMSRRIGMPQWKRFEKQHDPVSLWYNTWIHICLRPYLFETKIQSETKLRIRRWTLLLCMLFFLKHWNGKKYNLHRSIITDTLLSAKAESLGWNVS